MDRFRLAWRVCFVMLGVVALCALYQKVGDACDRVLRDAALLNAVKAGDTGSAEALLKQEANIEARNADAASREDEFTPLALAVARSNGRMVKMLLAHGANPNATTKADERFPSRDIVLGTAAEKGDAQIMTLLLDAGGHVDANAGMGVTPLMLATRDNHPDVVRLLLQRGANVNSRDERGFDPLYFARGRHRQNRAAVIRLLQDSGARSEASHHK